MAYCTFAFETCVVLYTFSRYHPSSEFGCLHETVLVVSSSICLNDFFFVSLLAQSFMMLHFCQKKEQNLGVTSVYSLLGLVRTRTLQYVTHFCFSIFVEQFALTICVGSKRILVGLAVNWPKF